MYATLFLHKFILKSLSFIHQKRLHILINCVTSLINNSRLTLSSLGRHLKGSAKVKNKIKTVDRLLGNQKLWKEKHSIYKALSQKLLSSAKEALILLDCSGCCSREHWIIRASLSGKGRSIVLYQEVHPIEKYGNDKIKKSFLKKLKEIIPADIKVTLITDAGFRIPWFKSIQKQGWDFLGRVRGEVKLCMNEGKEWVSVHSLHKKATQVASYLGVALLGLKQQFPVHVYRYRAPFQSRKFKRQKGKNLYPTSQKVYSRLNQEPWILVSSFMLSPKHIINLYKKRMQIEQTFRDDKNSRFGFGWRESRTRESSRYDILLLIAYLAALILWLIGRSAENKGLHKDFQANTSSQRALSYLNLGKQILEHLPDKITIIDIQKALKDVVWLQGDY